MGGKFGKSENKDVKSVRGLMERIEKLKNIFENVDADKREVITPLLDDVIFLEERLAELRKLPTIRYDKRNPAKQEVTPAGKQYKEYMQSYLNALKVLQMTLYRAGETGESPLLKALREFEADND